MRVKDVMTRRVLTVRPQDSIARARAMMRRSCVHQLVVLDRRRHVAGVIRAADVGDAPDDGAVEDFMCRQPLIVRPETAIGAAAALMRAHAVGSLPVLEGTRLVGIVTVSDMLDVVDDADGGFVPRIARSAHSRFVHGARAR